MKYKVLIFDFDGTIADTFRYLCIISNRLSEEFNYKKIDLNQIDKLKDNSSLEMISLLKVPFLKIPSIVARARDELNKDILSVPPISGLKSVLDTAKSLGYQMGILTTNSANNVSQFLKNHNMDVFDFISTSSRIWSKNINLKNVLQQHGYLEKDILYIGDEVRDIKAAQKAGIKIAAVTWGYNSEKALKGYSPDYLFTRPEDLLQYLS